MATATRRKLSPKQIEHAQALSQMGMSQREIASTLQVSQSSICLYLQDVQAASRDIAQAKDKLGDLLHLNHSLNQSVAHKVLTSLSGEDTFSGLTPREKITLLQVCQTGSGISFDKIRLHEGKSTVNTSHRIVRGEAYQSLDWDTTSSMVSGDDTKGLPSNNDVENVSD